jgi:hypothetical protein
MPINPAAMRDRFRKVAWNYRHIRGDYGLATHTVEVGLATWSGTHTGDGTETITWTPIVEASGQPPKVRWLTTEEIAVGALQRGSVRIGPITPDFSGGGTSAATLLANAATTGQTRYVRIVGPTHPDGARYLIQNTDFGAALHYFITAEPVSEETTAVAVDVLTDSSGNVLTTGGDTLLPE